jgi:hypothetical protein
MAGDSVAKGTGKRAQWRTLAEFDKLGPAEQILLEACRVGKPAKIADERPKKRTGCNSIRPAFLRFLALGCDDDTPLHERGVQLVGAWIDGDIDFQNCRISVPLEFLNCTVFGALALMNAELQSLALDGSEVHGIEGSGLRCRAFIFLRSGFHATAEVRLIAAHIGDNLECGGGHFDGAGKNALHCDQINIGGSVFMRDGFCTTGNVRLLNARIRGNLEFDKALFETSGENSLTCDRAQIDGALHFRKILKPAAGNAGVISFLAARVGTLTDDAASWESASAIILDGFHYDRITGVPRRDQTHSPGVDEAPPRDAKTRIAWLGRQLSRHLKEDFRPQPWQQLARVLMEMGHEDDGRTVLIEMRKRQRGSRWKYRDAWWKRTWWFVLTRFDWVLGALVAYGYRPHRAMWSLLGLWLVGGLVYWGVASAGIMAPTDAHFYLDDRIPAECKVDWIGFAGPRLPTSDEIAKADNDAVHTRLEKQISDDTGRRQHEARRVGLDTTQNWPWKSICDRAVPSEYSVFQPFVYSIDIMLPFLELRQEHDFAPRVLDDEGAVIRPLFALPGWLPLIGGTWGIGYFVRLWEWFEIFFGWTLTILVAASVSGIIKKD